MNRPLPRLWRIIVGGLLSPMLRCHDRIRCLFLKTGRDCVLFVSLGGLTIADNAKEKFLPWLVGFGICQARSESLRQTPAMPASHSTWPALAIVPSIRPCSHSPGCEYPNTCHGRS